MSRRRRGFGRGFVFQERCESGQGVKWISGWAGEVLIGIFKRQISPWVFRDEVAMGDVVVVDGLAKLFGAVSVAGSFEVFFDFAFDAFGNVFIAEFAGGIVAIFLESMELTREAAENVNGGRNFFGVGCELFADV